MKKWVTDNLAKVISGITVLALIIGFIGGMWKEQITIGKDVEKLQGQITGLRNQLRDMKDDVHDVNRIIQNIVLTKVGE